MAFMTALIQIKSDTNKKSLIEELERLDVPDDARLRVEHFKGDQREPSYTNLIWSWNA